MNLFLLTATVFVGSQPCGDCHRNIVRQYQQTAMARSAVRGAGCDSCHVSPAHNLKGVGCESCHGAGSEHIKGSDRMEMPSALGRARRDDICAQCHLRGESRTHRPGYRAGDVLAKFLTVRLSADPAKRTTGHTENFALSQCKQKAGDRLWCGTCHDVHQGTVNRNVCADCHTKKQCSRGVDCVGCHMPKIPGAGMHSVRTDHRIRKR